jgi:succinate dehydrogenase / fumarate reductase iron-sulfur subunit
MSLKVKIRRSDSTEETAASYEEFDVPVPAGERWSVMDVLDYIHETYDVTVRYYRHSICDQGICARCSARVDGKPELLCQCSSPNEGELVLEPVSKQVVKDLVSTPKS